MQLFPMQQVNATVSDMQAHIDSLEAGSRINHDAILSLDRKFETSMEGLARRLNGFMLMFSVWRKIRNHKGSGLQFNVIRKNKDNSVTSNPNSC